MALMGYAKGVPFRANQVNEVRSHEDKLAISFLFRKGNTAVR